MFSWRQDHQNAKYYATIMPPYQCPDKTRESGTPTTQITLLGIVINTESMTASISSKHKFSILTDPFFGETQVFKVQAPIAYWQTVICM